MYLYEFSCPKGHVTEELVPMGTKQVLCKACMVERVITHQPRDEQLEWQPPAAKRILSATPTTFRFNDRR